MGQFDSQCADLTTARSPILRADEPITPIQVTPSLPSAITLAYNPHRTFAAGTTGIRLTLPAAQSNPFYPSWRSTNKPNVATPDATMDKTLYVIPNVLWKDTFRR